MAAAELTSMRYIREHTQHIPAIFAKFEKLRDNVPADEPRAALGYMLVGPKDAPCIVVACISTNDVCIGRIGKSRLNTDTVADAMNGAIHVVYANNQLAPPPIRNTMRWIIHMDSISLLVESNIMRDPDSD